MNIPYKQVLVLYAYLNIFMQFQKLLKLLHITTTTWWSVGKRWSQSCVCIHSSTLGKLFAHTCRVSVNTQTDIFTSVEMIDVHIFRVNAVRNGLRPEV